MEFPKLDQTSYFTKRTLDNRDGKTTGEIVLWRLKDEKEFKYVLDCPFCKKHSEYNNLVLEKKPYKFKCPNCQKTIRIGKLKDSIKKRRKIETKNYSKNI
ncbi:MAG: hypothetical protein B6U87_00045 [Candidatus Aenigmarchaeota archaeon ex4484_52]|nr:MAG: hypothetical protein B6U87_00045 [Candidatus Aenigmarchaeota archaeon ex4484_52]